MKSEMGILTGDADVSFAALGGPRGAPSHTLTPEVLGPKQLLHLLTGDLNAGFSHHQACEDRWKTTEQGRRNAEAVSIRRPHGLQTLRFPPPGSDLPDPAVSPALTRSDCDSVSVSLAPTPHPKPLGRGPVGDASRHGGVHNPISYLR